MQAPPPPPTGEYAQYQQQAPQPHPQPQPPPAAQVPPPPPLHNTTRYLSAGVYLDERFRDRIVRELLGDRYRAVAPSLGGFDVVPVLSHTLRAERLSLIRDGAVTVLLLVLLILFSSLTVPWLLALLPLALLTLPRIRSGHLVWRVLLILWAILSLTSTGLVTAGLTATGLWAAGLGADGLGADAGPVIVPTLLLLVTFGAALAYWVWQHLALARALPPGAGHAPSGVPAKLRDRLAYLGQAQWGNVALHDGDNPYLGAGVPHRSWSVTVELDPPRGPADRLPPAPRPQTRIDPAALHAFVRRRVMEMRDAVDQPGERVDRMHSADHLAVRGTFTRVDWPSPAARHLRDQSHPLVDPATGLPHFVASPETIDSAIRQPQGGLSYYQRFTIGGEGAEVRGPGGILLAPAQDQGASVSAFLHVAVEGRMLYASVVTTVLPPVRAGFQVVDLLPSLGTGRAIWAAIRRVRLDLVADVVFAPLRLVRTLVRLARRSMGAPSPAAYQIYPFGARESVRELGAEPGPPSPAAEKYAAMVERRITGALLEYLDAHDVDHGPRVWRA
ncbi:hypothetical protein GCM10023259_033690 [Thermocatellispora tengchongensis]